MKNFYDLRIKEIDIRTGAGIVEALKRLEQLQGVYNEKEAELSRLQDRYKNGISDEDLEEEFILEAELLGIREMMNRKHISIGRTITYDLVPEALKQPVVNHK